MNEGHLGYDDGIFEDGQKRNIVHSKSSNVLINFKSKNKKVYLHTAPILDTDENVT